MQGVTSGPDQGICVTGSSRQTRRAGLAGCLTASRWLAGYATARPQWLAGYAPTRPHGLAGYAIIGPRWLAGMCCGEAGRSRLGVPAVR
jgi:hypothetical protein